MSCSFQQVLPLDVSKSKPLSAALGQNEHAVVDTLIMLARSGKAFGS